MRKLLDSFSIQTANVDLETDLMNSSLSKALKEYYDEDEGMTDKEVIELMQKHKGLNMYHFLQKKKDQLQVLKDDRIASLLFEAKDYIEENYGTNAHPA